jgi:hypothetical protein
MNGRFIIESFWQGSANCVAIVLIKASMLKYGVNKVFKAKKVHGQLLITLKNKKILTLAQEDISRINKKNRIYYSPYKQKKKKAQLSALRKYVELSFAVIVRNIHLYGYNGRKHTEASAIRLLTKEGLETDHIHDLLGLKRKTKSAHKLSLKHLQSFQRKKSVLLYSDKHIVIVSKGYYEQSGELKEIEKDKIPILNKKPAKYWFELK